MHSQPTTVAPIPGKLAPSKGGVLVLSGYGLSVSVERGHLAVSDGIAGDRRHGRLHRATSKLKRLVVLGHTGSVTFEALRWIHDVGAAFVQIDRDGVVILASGPRGRDLPRLRRAQALAPWTGIGTAIATQLLTDKLRGQANVVGQVDVSAASAIRELSVQLEPARSVEQLRLAESQAASLYWQALAPLPVRFARQDESKVPEHWRTFGSRMSPLTNSPRSAASPAQAVLNYLYGMLEAEARIACLAVGLDPGLAVLHADLRSRDSLACDLMEPVRPEVDRWLLGLLERRPFAAKDFSETRTGQCRVLPPLTHELAETLPLWSRAVAPVAERLAQQLANSQISLPGQGALWAGKSRANVARGTPGDKELATPLTQANRSAGRPSNNGNPGKLRPPNDTQTRGCRECGKPLPPSNRTLCSDACHEAYAREVAMPTFRASGPARLAELRAEGRDPTKTGTALQKLGTTQRERAAARAEWEREHTGQVCDPDDFRRDVLPLLQKVPLSAMMRSTRLSLRYCSQIRQGSRVPHPMYQAALRDLAAEATCLQDRSETGAE
jgi:CRISPR-associated endonuclease Cas1